MVHGLSSPRPEVDEVGGGRVLKANPLPNYYARFEGYAAGRVQIAIHPSPTFLAP